MVCPRVFFFSTKMFVLWWRQIERQQRRDESSKAELVCDVTCCIDIHRHTHTHATTHTLTHTLLFSPRRRLLGDGGRAPEGGAWAWSPPRYCFCSQAGKEEVPSGCGSRYGGNRERAFADSGESAAGTWREGCGEGSILRAPPEVHQPEGRAYRGEGQACARPLELHRRRGTLIIAGWMDASQVFFCLFFFLQLAEPARFETSQRLGPSFWQQSEEIWTPSSAAVVAGFVLSMVPVMLVSLAWWTHGRFRTT